MNGPFIHVPAAELCRRFESNVFGTVQARQSFFPLLKRNTRSGTGHGRTISISSTSGRLASPFFGPCVASKHVLKATR